MSRCRRMGGWCIQALILLLGVIEPVWSADAILPVQHWKKDGLAVYFVPVSEVPMAKVTLLFKAGVMYDRKPSVAYLTASLLDQGTSDLDADALAERFASHGIGWDTGADLSHAWVAWQSTIAAWDAAADGMVSMLQDLSFPQQAIERRKQQMLRAVEFREQSAQQRMALAFRQSLYGAKHPFGHDLLGQVADINTLQRPDVQRFYRQHYALSQAALLVVGQLSRKEVDALAQRISAVLPKHTPRQALRLDVPMVPVTEKHLPFQGQQSHVVVGQPSVMRDDPDFYPLVVANHILGGDMLGSRLFKAIREERGLAYTVNSSLQAMPQQHTLWRMGLQTKADQAEEARQLLLAMAKHMIDDGPTAQEVRAAKGYLQGAFPLHFGSTAARMARLLWLVKQDLPLNHYEQYLGRIAAVTQDEVHAAMQKHWHPKDWQVVTLGPSP